MKFEIGDKVLAVRTIYSSHKRTIGHVFRVTGKYFNAEGMTQIGVHVDETCCCCNVDHSFGGYFGINEIQKEETQEEKDTYEGILKKYGIKKS